MDSMNPNLVKEIDELSLRGSKAETFQVAVEGKQHTILIGRDRQGGLLAKSLKDVSDTYREHPERIAGTAKATTLDSFIALVARHKNADTALFARVAGGAPALLAVIDYHTLDHQPRRAGHRVHYEFPMSDELRAWRGNNGETLGQGDFAEFIEERIADVAAADEHEQRVFGGLFRSTFATPADLMQISREFEVNVETEIKTAKKLQSGETRIVFAENHSGIDVPGLFVVNIPLFENGRPQRLIARLRYRIHGPEVGWTYDLYRLDDAIRLAVRQDVDLAARTLDLRAFEGEPESAR